MNPDKMKCDKVHFKYKRHGKEGVSETTVELDWAMTVIQINRLLQWNTGWIIEDQWFPNERICEVRYISVRESLSLV